MYRLWPALFLLSRAISATAAGTAGHSDTGSASGSFLHFPIRESAAHLPPPPSKHASKLSRRQQLAGAVVSPVLSHAAYAMNITVGTPPQEQTVSIDTGSGVLWVNATCPAGKEPGSLQCPSAYFHEDESSSLKYTGDDYTIGYADQSKAYLLLASESVGIGSENCVTLGTEATIQDQLLGIAEVSSDIHVGILGLAPKSGFRGLELQERMTVVESLAAQGIIESSLIFGGIDAKKYSGNLQKVPLLPRESHFIVSLTAVGSNSSSSSTWAATSPSDAFDVVLDSGSTFNVLPSAIYDAIVSDFPGVLDVDDVFTSVDCDVKEIAEGSIDFTLGNATISVSYADMITTGRWFRASSCGIAMQRGGADDGELSQLRAFSIWCFYVTTRMRNGNKGQSADQTVYFIWFVGDVSILGNSFFRAAYMVFDQDNEDLYVAQSADCGSRVVSIGKSNSTTVVPDFEGCSSS
ncbi:putative acid protease [Zalerion maritima]|uniref:Acid protease n=1 Tax=Zalerion maritima TaxID=339359 RepID=A0AAD5RXL0_9PEZI|nr:putative acid protease [Zalerion maritima]